MTMGSDLDTVGRNSIINKLSSRESLPRHRETDLPDCLQKPTCSGTFE